MPIIAVFHAALKPNENDEYNWLEFKDVKKVDLATLQENVGGNITLLPYYGDDKKAPFDAYAQDDGLLHPDFARNDLAGGVLSLLDFGGSELLGCSYANNVVVTTDKGLSQDQQQMLLATIDKYREDLDEEI